MKPYLIGSLLANALLTALLVWGAFLSAADRHEALETAQALEVSEARLRVAHTSIDVGEHYFQVCLKTLEESAEISATCQRRLARCQEIH